MKAAGRFPQGYENVPVRKALDAINAEPTLQALDALLEAALAGGLVVDVTGSTDASGPRVRTIASTTGEPVLPLFTSMKALRDAVGATAKKGTKVQAIIIPSREALALIETADFVAVQFNPGTNTMVVARSHIESALSGR
jgi:hypothetical protein